MTFKSASVVFVCNRELFPAHISLAEFYASWKVKSRGFFPKISRFWKVLENEFSSGKS